MKIWITYIGTFACCFALFLSLSAGSASPETLILGNWSEFSWEYEKGDKIEKNGFSNEQIPNDVMESLGQSLLLHQAEKWQFLPDGKLIIHTKDDAQRFAHWSLKGRGHILQLHYSDQPEENYEIYELNRHELVLYFNVEMQVKGIAKMSFKR